MFYRVLCVTLLAIACTFTVILTNVFVDIDLILARKDQANPETDVQTQIDHELEKSINMLAHDKLSKYDYDEAYHHDDDESQLRTKRSLGLQNYQGNMKNPKIKHLLTNRLATLLEELDAEVSTSITPSTLDGETDQSDKTKIKQETENDSVDRKTSEKYLLRLAMHNILLDGIINHIDLNEIYRELHKLGEKFQTEKSMNDRESMNRNKETTTAASLKMAFFNTDLRLNDDKKVSDEELLTELTKSVYRWNKITRRKEGRANKVENKNNKEKIQNKHIKENNDNLTTTSRPYTITTTVKQSSNATNGKSGSKLLITATIDIVSNPKENITLTANDVEGQVYINFNGKRVTDAPTTVQTNITEVKTEINPSTEKIPNTDFTYLHQFLQQYFKMYNKDHEDPIHKVETKRVKRHIKFHYNKKDKFEKKHWQKDDDELLVEIKTHFNNKGLRDDRKKKLIATLIGKIEKAVHGDLDKTLVAERENNRFNLRNHLLNHHLEDDNNLALNTRLVDPLVKFTSPLYPKIITTPKYESFAVIDTDYDEPDPVQQRSLAPITANDKEMLLANTIIDLRNRIQTNGLDGGGFSIRFNENKPDEESLKMFSFLENFLKTYQMKPVDEDALDINSYDRVPYEYNQNRLVKRDLKLSDYDEVFGLDEYVDNNLVSTTENPYVIVEPIKSSQRKERELLNLIINKDLLTRDLKPGELMNFATLLDRNIRSTDPKKNRKKSRKALKTKKKNGMRKKKLNKPIKKSRSKRQISFSDNDSPMEEFFLMSNENGFIRKIQGHDQNKQAEQFQRKEKEKEDESEEPIPQPQIQNMRTPKFIISSKRNSIIFPHKMFNEFLKEDAYAPEEFPKPEQPVVKETVYIPKPVRMDNDDAPDLQDLLQALTHGTSAGARPKSNFKISVKVSPAKNVTNPLTSGFKEIHTSINKTFNRNGINFFSLVNVSEISKIENMKSQSPNLDHIKNQQETMKTLLSQQKDIIDTQLKRLQNEKSKIDEIISDAKKAIKPSTEKPAKKKTRIEVEDVLKGHLPPTLSKLVHLNHGEVKMIINAVLEKLQSMPNMELQYSEVAKMEKIKTTTEKVQEATEKPEPMTLRPIPKTVVNLTNEILKKIDRNTDMLAQFLAKMGKKNNIKIESVTTAVPNLNTVSTESNINAMQYNSYQTHQAASTSRLADFVRKMNQLHENYKRNPDETLYLKLKPSNNTNDDSEYMNGKFILYDHQKPMYVVNKQDISNIFFRRMSPQGISLSGIFPGADTNEPSEVQSNQENAMQKNYDAKMVRQLQYPLVYNMTVTN